MVYLYETTSSMVRQCLGHFSDDLTVKMDGRRFLFESTKMEQLKWDEIFFSMKYLKVLIGLTTMVYIDSSKNFEIFFVLFYVDKCAIL